MIAFFCSSSAAPRPHFSPFCGRRRSGPGSAHQEEQLTKTAWNSTNPGDFFLLFIFFVSICLKRAVRRCQISPWIFFLTGMENATVMAAASGIPHPEILIPEEGHKNWIKKGFRRLRHQGGNPPIFPASASITRRWFVNPLNRVDQGIHLRLIYRICGSGIEFDWIWWNLIEFLESFDESTISEAPPLDSFGQSLIIFFDLNLSAGDDFIGLMMLFRIWTIKFHFNWIFVIELTVDLARWKSAVCWSNARQFSSILICSSLFNNPN